MFNKKHLIGILLGLIMVCSLVTVVDTVSAAKYKTIDKDSKIFEEKGVTFKAKLYAKSNGKTVKSKCVFYSKSDSDKKYKKYAYMKTSSKKISKKNVKSSVLSKFKGNAVHKGVFNDKSLFSINKYYFKHIKLLYRPFGF